MARAVPYEIKIGDLPAVKEALARAADEIGLLRSLLQEASDVLGDYFDGYPESALFRRIEEALKTEQSDDRDGAEP